MEHIYFGYSAIPFAESTEVFLELSEHFYNLSYTLF